MDYMIGQIILLAYAKRPISGMLKCEGQILPITRNEALYSLLGTTYGGDGSNNFALPNLKGKEPVQGMAYYIVTNGIYPQFD